MLLAKVVQFGFMSLFITAFFYTYTGALGVEEQVLVDIMSFVAAIAAGQYLS